MEGYKLIDRMEKVEWVPPVLRFQIERHGATVKGSSRAELHEWTIDLCKATAECVSKGSRQIIPMAPRLNVPHSGYYQLYDRATNIAVPGLAL